MQIFPLRASASCMYKIVHLVSFKEEAKLGSPRPLQGAGRWPTRERLRLAYACSVMRRGARSTSAR